MFVGGSNHAMRGGYHIDHDKRIEHNIIPIGLHHHADYGDHEEDLDEAPMDEFSAEYQEDAPVLEERVFRQMFIVVVPPSKNGKGVKGKAAAVTKKRRAKRA